MLEFLNLSLDYLLFGKPKTIADCFRLAKKHKILQIQVKNLAYCPFLTESDTGDDLFAEFEFKFENYPTTTVRKTYDSITSATITKTKIERMRNITDKKLARDISYLEQKLGIPVEGREKSFTQLNPPN